MSGWIVIVEISVCCCFVTVGYWGCIVVVVCLGVSLLYCLVSDLV